jgi:hypothetical protein
MHRGPLIVLSWLVAVPALADAAPPTPEEMECPRGAVGRVEVEDERGWTAWCAPSICSSDAECDGDRICSAERISLCVEDQRGQRSVRARGCEPDGTCLNIHSTCETSRRCVRPEAGTAPAVAPELAEPVAEPAVEQPPPTEEAAAAADVAAPPSDCGCRAAPSRAAPLGLLGLLGWLALRRRR